jgi:hypothetical protein
MSPIGAQNGHAAAVAPCPLSGGMNGPGSDASQGPLRTEPDDLFSSIKFLRVVLLFVLAYEHSVQVWAGNFRRATRAGRNPKAEVMQFDDRGDHAQPQTQAFGVSTFV